MAKRKKFWIAGAIKKPGALRAKAKAAGALKDGISPSYLAEKAKEGGTTGKQARLARTLKSFHKGGSSSSKAPTRESATRMSDKEMDRRMKKGGMRYTG